MPLKSIFSGWQFDIKTALVTVLGAPLILYFVTVIRKYLKNWGTYALEGVMYWLSRSFKRSLAGALTLKQYCRLRLAEENRYLFVPSSLDVKLPIDEVFVTLSLGHQGEKSAIFNHRDILTAGNRIRVIGDPGSGKSSLVKRLFRDACYNALEKPSRAQLPILVELKTLTVSGKHTEEKLGEWFVQKLRENVSKSRVYQMPECFDTYAENSGLLVLLDGLDEISSSKYTKVQLAITSLSKRLAELGSRNTIVLTMRTQFHQQVRDAYRDSFGPALFLKPFSPTDVYEFLARWPFRANRDANITRIYGELTDRPTLREMCSNPLILSMYVAEDQAAGHVVAPESRTEFYRKVTEELIIKRRLQQTGPTPAYTTLREQRERILGKVAYEHMLDANEPTNSLSLEKAITTISEVMLCSKQDAKTAFFDISKETGLISEERPGQTYRFIHLTFCEFLAGFEAVQGQHEGWKRLINAHRAARANVRQPEMHTRLVEVIPFACGLLPRIHRERAISDVTMLNDDGLLARCFLETKQYAHPCWPEFVERQRKYIIETPEADWDERWLRNLHLFNVVIKDAKECSAHMPVAKVNIDLDRFFEALAGSQKASLSKLLSAYAAQDAAAAFRLAEVSGMDLADDFPDIVIYHCDQAPFFALAVERALRYPEQITKWAQLLVEAALRSRVVAVSLHEIAAANILVPTVNSIPQRKRWCRSGIIHNSLYSQMLTVATNSPINVLPCLNTLKGIPAPGSMWINPTISIIIQPLLIIAFGLFYYFHELLTLHSLKPANIVLFAVVLYATMPLILMGNGKMRIYHDLIYPGRSRNVLGNKASKSESPTFMELNLVMIRRIYEYGAGRDLRRALKQMTELRATNLRESACSPCVGEK